MSDVSFDIRKGETLALVSESGCSKSANHGPADRLASRRAPAMWWLMVRDMKIALSSNNEGCAGLAAQSADDLQDPVRDLNPRWRVADIVAGTHSYPQAHRNPSAPNKRVAELLGCQASPQKDGEVSVRRSAAASSRSHAREQPESSDLRRANLGA